jgi:hypothetical protein
MRIRGSVAFSVVVMLVGCTSKPPLVAAPPLHRDATCLDLPGAYRANLMLSDDGQSVFYAERVRDDQGAHYAIVRVTLATKKAEVVVPDIGDKPASAHWIVRGGDDFAVLRPVGQRNYRGARDNGVFAAGAGYTEPVRISRSQSAVSLVADDLGHAYFIADEGTWKAAYDENMGAKYQTYGGSLSESWVLSTFTLAPGADGGGLTSLGRQVADLYGFADDGGALVLDGLGPPAPRDAGAYEDAEADAGAEEEWQTSKRPTAGGPSVRLGGRVGRALASEGRVYMKSRKGGIQWVDAAGGEPADVAGSSTTDVLAYGGPALAWRTDAKDTPKRASYFLRLNGGALGLLAAAENVGVADARVSPTGDVVALAIQDTNGDGAFDEADEADLCVLPAGSVATLSPRTAPKRDAQMAATLAPLVEAGAVDFTGAKLRFEADGTNAALDAPGAWLATGDPDAGSSAAPDYERLRARVKDLQKRTAELSGDPRMGLVIRLRASGRIGQVVWDPARQALVSGVGVWDGTLLPDPKELLVELHQGGQISGETATCSGQVTNISDHPLTLEVECQSYDVYDRETRKALRAKVDPSPLPPGAQGSSTIVLDGFADHMSLRQRVLENDKELPYLDRHAMQKARAWIDAIDRIFAATGLRLRPGDEAPAVRHDDPSFDVPDGFDAATKEKREQSAATLAKELGVYYGDFGTMVESAGTVLLFEGDAARWKVTKDGELSAVGVDAGKP